jgi:uncharacterized protein (UPF0261 family)
MGKRIALIGALDTKGPEFAFVKQEIERRGHVAVVVDTSVVGEPAFRADIPRELVAEAGGVALTELQAKADRGQAIEVMTRGVARVVKDLHDQGKIDAVLSMGGSAGTVIGTSAMRALPIGVPKVMVSTVASGDTRPYVGTRDVVMVPSVVDVAGVNRISARIFANAVGAVVGMVETPVPEIQEKPLLAASMFGNTTPIVTRCRETMERQGYEVLVFHATGTGGQTMEHLVRDGYFAGVLDITTTEWADELVGGVLSAGPTRLDAAAERGVPQVIVPGCLDMVNFWARETVPEKFKDRLFYQWNPNVTLMRTTPEENRELGRILAEKANRSTGPVAFLLPRKGVSMLDAPGKEFWWPEADAALFDSIRQHVRPDIEVIELDYNINDEQFADAVSAKMLELLGVASTRGG